MATHFTYDQDKVKELRMKLIYAGIAVLDEKAEVKRWSSMKKKFVLKAAIRALPILNAGRDDDKDLIPLPLLGGITNDTRNNRIKKTAGIKEKDS